MTNPFGQVATATGKVPIGVQGVIDYCDEMNSRYPNAPYIWRVGQRMHEGEGRMVKCVDVIRKSELRNAGPRLSSSDAERLISSTTRALENA